MKKGNHLKEQVKLDVSVVCPFFNEDKIIISSVEKMYRKLVENFQNKFQLILVNDGSTDDSVHTLLEFLKNKKYRNVKVVSSPLNQGRGRALKNGIEFADAEIIVTTEVDFSWGEQIVEQLFNVLKSNSDIDFVTASPHLKKGGFSNVPIERVILSKFGNLLIRLFFESKITMNTGMTRAYRKNVIKPLFTERDGKEFHLEVLLKLTSLGFRCREIPATITWSKISKQGKKKTKKSSTKIFPNILTHLSFIVLARPIRQFGFFAAATFFSGSVFFLFEIVKVFYGAAKSVTLIQTGFFLYLISFVFAAFTIQFFQIRELLRAKWMEPYLKFYSSERPPSRKGAKEIFPMEKGTD